MCGGSCVKFTSVVTCLVVSLEVKVGVGVEQVRGGGDTMFETGEVQFWVGHGGVVEEGVERTTAVLGVVGGDTTV